MEIEPAVEALVRVGNFEGDRLWVLGGRVGDADAGSGEGELEGKGEGVPEDDAGGGLNVT